MPVWYAFYDLQPENRESPILISLDPTCNPPVTCLMIVSRGNDVTHKGLQMTIPLHVIMTWCIRNFRNLCLELNHSLLWFNTEIHHTIEMLQEADFSYIIKSITTPVLNTEQVQATHISVVQQRILSVQHRAVERWALYTHCSIYCSRNHSIINC